MKSMFAAALFAATFAAVGVASAAPMTPIVPSPASGDLIQVAQGCGPGFARGPYGRCRPMYRAYRRPPVVVVRPGRACPRGFTFRHGRCSSRY